MVEFVALVGLMMALTALSIDIMLPALPEIGEALAVTDENARQLVITAYMLGFAAGQVVYGPLSDRFGRKPVLLFGLMVFSAAAFWSAVAPSFDLLLAARFVQGIGCAAPRVVALAVVRDLHGGRDMARIMSFVMMVFIIAPIIAPGLGQIVLVAASWEWIFLFLMAVGLATTIWAMSRLPETRPAAAREPLSLSWLGGAVWQTISTRQTLGYTLATGFVFGSLIGYINSAQQIFVEIYAATGAQFPILFGIVAAPLAAASFLNGRLVARLGMRWLSHMALTGFLVTSLLHLAIIAIWGLPPLWAFCALVSANLFFFGFTMPNFNALGMEPLGHIAGTAASFIGAVTTACGAVLGWYIGQQFDGTVLPLALGYVLLGASALAIVAFTEGGRLFQPQR